MPFCRNCGSELPATARFCNSCGASTEIAPAPTTEEAPSLASLSSSKEVLTEYYSDSVLKKQVGAQIFICVAMAFLGILINSLNSDRSVFDPPSTFETMLPWLCVIVIVLCVIEAVMKYAAIKNHRITITESGISRIGGLMAAQGFSFNYKQLRSVSIHRSGMLLIVADGQTVYCAVGNIHKVKQLISDKMYK